MRRTDYSALNDRKQVILRAVVVDYVKTAEPVGSHAIETRYRLGVKSATIRNELAELSSLGYLMQPHTSAGRVPSDMGYRFYVDRLMGEPMKQAGRAMASARVREIESIIESTCRLLAQMSHYASFVTHPDAKSALISHISVTRVNGRTMLAVLVLNNGRVFHELIELDSRFAGPHPEKASNMLSEKLVGHSLESVGGLADEEFADDMDGCAELYSKVVDFAKRELELSGELDVHLEGTGYIMQQPEFRDVERLEAVISALGRREAIIRLLNLVRQAQETTVVIGSENPVEEMRECSFVGTHYRSGGRVAGTIGVVGPTRMDYERAVGAVELMARSLGQILSEFSL